MSRLLFVCLFAVFSGGIFTACVTTESEPTDPVCDPGEQERCECGVNVPGIQICREDRSGWLDCVCGEDGDHNSSDGDRDGYPEDGDIELSELEASCMQERVYPSLTGSCPENQVCLSRQSQGETAEYGCLLADEFYEGRWVAPQENPEYQKGSTPHCPDGYLQDAFTLDGSKPDRFKRCLIECQPSEEAECIPGNGNDILGRDVQHCCDKGLLVWDGCPALNIEVDECSYATCNSNASVIAHLLPDKCRIDGVCYSDGFEHEQACAVCDAEKPLEWSTPDGYCPGIDGKCYSEGQVYAGSTCKICKIESDKAFWGVSDGSCLIQGNCYLPGEYDENICKICSPSANQNQWANADEGDSCEYNGNPNAGKCNGQGECVSKY